MHNEKGFYPGHWALLIFLALGRLAPGGDVSLAWDASTSPGVTGYKIYYGTASRAYSAHDVVPNQTTWTVRNLAANVTWYFAATAFDDSGNESGFSNEVFVYIEPASLEILNQSISVNWFGVVCMAMTSQQAAAVFRYQKIGGSGTWHTIIASPAPGAREHRAVIYSAQLDGPGYYRYQWNMENETGAASAGSTFQVGE